MFPTLQELPNTRLRARKRLLKLLHHQQLLLQIRILLLHMFILKPGLSQLRAHRWVLASTSSYPPRLLFEQDFIESLTLLEHSLQPSQLPLRRL